MRTHQSLVLFTVMIFCVLHGTVLCAAPPSIQDECSGEFAKVGVCLNYATGKADTPSKECCSTVKDIKDKNAVCLCFVIQEVHDGSNSLKQMGLQEAKLLQLPGACSLVNASIADCPKLLGLSPNSPDYGIFNTSTSSPATTKPATRTSSSPAKDDSSMGFQHKPLLASSIAVAVTMAMFISESPMGFSSYSL